MDQTRGTDRRSTLSNQIIEFLRKRFEVPGVVVGGDYGNNLNHERLLLRTSRRVEAVCGRLNV